MRKQPDASFADSGVIRPDELYQLDAAKVRLGWGRRQCDQHVVMV